MTVDDTPQLPENPEAEGIPDHASDTSTAFDEAHRPRFDDSPPMLPGDEPRAVDEVRLTSAEAREGASLDDRLAREEPEALVGTGGRGEGEGGYDAPDPGGLVGRLVAPDEGARADTERELIAQDQGEAGGGESAEEAAMHEVPGQDVPYRG